MSQLHAQTEPSGAEELEPTTAKPEVSEPKQGDFARGGLANAVMGKPVGAVDEADGSTKAEPMTSREIALWSLVSIASATLITGAVFGLAAGADKTQYDKNSDGELKSQSENKAIVSVVSFGVAGAAAIAAFVLWITHRDGFDNKPKPVVASGVFFSVGVDGASVSIPF